MYHDILADPKHPDESGFTGEDAATYKVSVDRFQSHLDFFSKNLESAPIVMSEFPETTRLRSPDAWCLTFDDGGSSAYTMAAKNLEEYNWRGHFFITTERLGQPGFLNHEQVRELHDRGHVIGSHSHSHPPRISELSFDAIINEWKTSIGVLQTILGNGAFLETASVPGGFYSHAVGRAASEMGIRFLFTSQPVSQIEAVSDCTLLGRYAIRHNTSSPQAIALATGDWRVTTPTRMQWAVRSLAKCIGGSLYENIRKKVLRR